MLEFFTYVALHPVLGHLTAGTVTARVGARAVGSSPAHEPCGLRP